MPVLLLSSMPLVSLNSFNNAATKGHTRINRSSFEDTDFFELTCESSYLLMVTGCIIRWLEITRIVFLKEKRRIFFLRHNNTAQMFPHFI